MTIAQEHRLRGRTQMRTKWDRRAFVGGAAVVLAAPYLSRRVLAEDAIKLRCSLDTAPSHPRNQAIVDYLAKLDEASKGRIKSEVFHSGQLFADLNVTKALIQGQVDMASPGTWTMTGLVPDGDFSQLPILYAQSVDIIRRCTDGAPGALVEKQLEAKLHSHILGRWLELGYENWYLTKKAVESLDDFNGLKIRSPGGAGISWRIAFVHGIANVTPWPNVPLALSQGTFDGFVSTDESCTTAKLWEAGVRNSYADHQYSGQYIPMISGTFWDKLSPDQQKLMRDLWAQNIGSYRTNAAAAQMRARRTMEDNGVTFVDPSKEELASARKRMQ